MGSVHGNLEPQKSRLDSFLGIVERHRKLVLFGLPATFAAVFYVLSIGLGDTGHALMRFLTFSAR